jgi:hypothetical protein
MLEAENLLSAADEVLVVPARLALTEYRELSAYVCQPNRAFRQVERMAFYTLGEIAPFVPKIAEIHDAVEFRRGAHPGRLGNIVDDLIDRSRREEGRYYKVMLLTPEDDGETIRLSAPIANDRTSDAGRHVAFTQGHCYVSLSRLKTARTTSELVR